jgi:hypothetical protein
MQVKSPTLVEIRRRILIKVAGVRLTASRLDFYLLIVGLMAARLRGPIGDTHSRSAKMVFGL